MSHNVFWDRVKQKIKEKKSTQKDAAAACNVSLRTFKYWIYKNLYPTIVDGFHLARFLGVSVEYLVTGRETGHKKQIDALYTLLKKAEKDLATIKF